MAKAPVAELTHAYVTAYHGKPAAGASLTPAQWAAALLHRLGVRQTPGALQAVIGWQQAEGGHWHNGAKYNPLNTTMPAKGAGNTGSQGNIKVYRSWDQGLDATVRTLKNGLYGGILHALKAGDPNAVGQAIEGSPWGTGGLAAKVIGQTRPSRSPVAVPGGLLGGAGSSGGANAQNGAGGVSGAAGGTRQDVELGTKTTFDQAGFEQAQKKALLAGFLTKHGRGSSVLFKSGLLSTAAPNPGDFTTSALTSRIISKRAPSAPSAPSADGSTAKPADVKGTAMFEGHRVAAWIKPELEYARKHGWKGTINSGFRSYADQKRIYDSGVRPAAKPGQSNHEGADFPRGAVDVSDAATLSRILRKKGSPLVWAGAKDAVHFSHPHNGSY